MSKRVHGLVGADPKTDAKLVVATRKSEAQIKEQARLLDLARDAIMVRDMQDRIKFWNHGAEELYGWTAAEVQGKEAAGFLYQDEPAAVAAARAAVIANGEWTGECKHTRKSGGFVTVRSRWTLVRDELGAPQSILIINTDISEGKRAGEELANLQRRHQLILQSIGEGVHGIGLNGAIIFENPAAAKLLGTKIQDLVGKPAHETIHHSHGDGSAYPREECPIYQTLRDGVVRHREEFFWRLDGTSFPVDYVSAPLRDEQGEIAGGVVTFRDITERKEAEEALGRQEKQYRILFETHPNPTWVYDAKTLAFLAVNDAAVEHYGYSRKEFLGLTIRDIRPQEDVPALIEASDATAASGKKEPSRHSGIWRHRKRNGEILFADIYTTNIQFEGHAAHLAIAIDITEKKEAEDAIRQSEERMRAVLESALDCVITIDHLGRIIEFNPAAEKTFGYERRQAIGQVLAELIIPPSLRERHQRGLTRYLSTGKGAVLGKRVELTGMRSDQSEFPLELAITRIGSQEPPMFTGFIRDITDRKQAEERLLEQADIINRAHDAIIVRNVSDQRVTFWNSGAERLYGWSADEAIGRCLGELLFADAKDREEPLEILASTGEFHSGIKQIAKDGRELIVDSRATLVHNPDGTPRSVLLINTDVTEQKKLETHLLRAQRLESIGTLASGVAHDLNNILTPILMCAEMLRKKSERDPVPLVSLIEESARRGAGIVKQVLTFARGVEGERVLINATHLIQEMADIAKKTFPKNIEITGRYPENLWSIKGDPTQLHQVLLNLSVNARDAMPKGGSLTIAAENFNVDEHYASMTLGAKAGPYVMLRVSDTGTGMPRPIIDKMFDPFFTTKDMGKGTGLGLSTVLGIVKSHDGFMSIYSEVGSGTTFKIFLPAEISGAVASQSEMSFESLQGNDELILVVDDEPGILRITRLILESNNYRVLTANDAPEALGAIAEHKDVITAVMTDISMPHMDGVALIRAVKKMRPEMIFVASTGHSEETRVSELQSLGVAHFLIKPYDTQQLLNTLRDALVTRRK
jgi:PAS domain S-box-containing protein